MNSQQPQSAAPVGRSENPNVAIYARGLFIWASLTVPHRHSGEGRNPYISMRDIYVDSMKVLRNSQHGFQPSPE